MILPRFIYREIRHSGMQAVTFMLCVALSIATLIALNSFKRDVHRSLLSDAQSLHGGDVIAHSHYPFSVSLRDAVTALGDRLAEKTETYEFYTVVRSERGDGSLFANIKAVQPAYPLYGEMQLSSGKDFRQLLRPGYAIVATDVLDRLGIRIGDRLQIGDSAVVVADSLSADPTQPVSIFSLGPRVYVSSEDLERINLLGTGSRSEYEILIKLTDPRDAQDVAELLGTAATTSQQERVVTARNARSQIKRFFDNMMFFLSFISIFTLLLSGIGMQSSLMAMVRKKQETIAIAKTVGASYRFLFNHYLVVVLLLGFVGCVGGVAAGFAIKHFFPVLFQGVLPPDLVFGLEPADLFEGLLVGLAVTLLFTFLPLYRIGSIKPFSVFRRDYQPANRKPVVYLIIFFSTVFFCLLVIRQLEDVRTGVYFIAGCMGLILLMFLLTSAALRIMRRSRIRNLALRQSVRSLFRPGNASRSIVVTLGSALTVLLTIYLIEFNLFSSFISSYPEDAPNLFCLDIQQDQRQQFSEVVGTEVELYPVIRARLMSINGEPIDYERERRRKSDSLAREFNLTYRDALLGDERIVSGSELFGSDRLPDGVVEVSVLDTIAEIGDIALADRLRFNIQGRELEAQVTSIRTRTKSMLYPFFYFVFTEEVLGAAPQTLFAAMHVERSEIPGLINEIVRELPNVSTINVAETADRLGQLIRRLAGIITFFAGFSILAGCLILVSAVFATRLERIRESVYYKVLGGTSRFLFSILVYENAILGLMSSAISIFCAQLSGWLLCRYFFEIPFTPHLGAALGVMCVTTVMTVGIGVLSSAGTIRNKPVSYLRQVDGG